MADSELPAPLPVREQGFSLEADMLFGWRPQVSRAAPIKLKFSNRFPSPKAVGAQPCCVFQGYRPHNSYEVHTGLAVHGHSYSFNFHAPEALACAQQSHLVGRPQSATGMRITEGPVFNSQFECGNLDKAFQVGPAEFDLYLRTDSNTKGYLHWFYFSVSRVPAGTRLRFNIVNFSKSTSLYSSGMSVRVRRSGQSGWGETKTNLCFGLSKLNRAMPGVRRKYFQLSFDYMFKRSEEVVWFATAIPYTFQQVQDLMKELKLSSEFQTSHVKVKTLCNSLSLCDIPLLTITSPKYTHRRPLVLVIGRTHPAETVGSWTMEGFIKFVASKHRIAKKLRKQFVFKIVPMVNVDGVILGNSRTSMCGKDLNRYYHQAEGLKPLEDIVQVLGKIISRSNVFLFLDLHGHFGKKGCFTYGPHYPLHHSLYYKAKILPKLLSERNEAFRLYSCRYKQERRKTGAARVVMLTQHAVKYAYTIETSYYGYVNAARESRAFSASQLIQLGADIAQSVYDLHNLLKQDSKAPPAKKKKPKRVLKRKLSDVINEIIEDENGEHSDSPSEESDTEEELSAPEPDCSQLKLPSVKTVDKSQDKVLHSQANKDLNEKTEKKVGSFVEKTIDQDSAPKTRRPPIKKYLPTHFTKPDNSPSEPRRVFRPTDSLLYKVRTPSQVSPGSQGIRAKSTMPELCGNSIYLTSRYGLRPRASPLERIGERTPKAYVPQYFRAEGSFVNRQPVLRLDFNSTLKKVP